MAEINEIVKKNRDLDAFVRQIEENFLILILIVASESNVMRQKYQILRKKKITEKNNRKRVP